MFLAILLLTVSMPLTNVMAIAEEGSEETDDFLVGDVNTDGIISAADARRVLRISAALEVLEPSLWHLADINKDGKISAADARMLLRASAGLEDLVFIIPERPDLLPSDDGQISLMITSENEPDIGDEFKLTLSLANAAGLAAADLYFTYDTNKLEFMSDNTLSNSVFSLASGSPAAGRVAVSMAAWEELTSADNIFELASFKFKALKEGEANIKIFANSLTNANDETMSFKVINPLISFNKYCEEGHSFGEWEITKQLTCTENGVESRECSLCQHLETRTIPATGHNFGEWIIEIEPTTQKEGKEVRTCMNLGCNASESRTIAKLPTPSFDFTDDSSAALVGNTIRFTEPIKLNELLLHIENSTLKAYYNKTNEISADGALGTGNFVILYDSKGNEVQRYTVIVFGDMNGDGKISAVDARRALRISAKLEIADSWQEIAGDVNKNGEIQAVDARTILRVSAGLQKMTDSSSPAN